MTNRQKVLDSTESSTGNAPTLSEVFDANQGETESQQEGVIGNGS